jgi:hypothetical protein
MDSIYYTANFSAYALPLLCLLINNNFVAYQRSMYFKNQLLGIARLQGYLNKYQQRPKGSCKATNHTIVLQTLLFSFFHHW